MRLLKGALSRRKSPHSASSERRPSVLSQVSYTAPQKAPSVTVSIRRDDLRPEQDRMSTKSSSTSRPQSSSNVSRQHARGPFCFKRPTLEEILQNKAHAPWTLEAFTAYSSRNLCLENLEFLQDADRYKDAYNTIFPSQDLSKPSRRRPSLRRFDSAQLDGLREMWTRLILHYIAPSSPRELNLPGDIRNSLVSLNKSDKLPPPESLKVAISTIYELIQGSILFSFFNDVQPITHDCEHLNPNPDSVKPLSPRLREMASPLHQAKTHPPSSFSQSPKLGGFAMPQLDRPRSHLSSKTSNSSVNASLEPTLTDDTGSMNSPSTVPDRIQTPPGTPPTTTRRRSARNSSDAGWKRMSMRLGFRKRSTSNLKGVAERGNEYAVE